MQNGESQQRDARSDEPCPADDGHARQRHALSPQIQGCGDEVQRAQQRGDAEDKDRQIPTGFAQVPRQDRNLCPPRSAEHKRSSRRVGAVGNKERRHQNAEGDERRPERHHVEAREGHVFRANLDG